MLAETEAFEIVEGTVRLTRRLEEIATPESIREVVRDRVSRLPPPTRDLLDLASVAGPEFELETLRRAAPHAGSLSLEGLEPAERSGLIEEIPSRSIAYRFTHELVRRALYDRLSGPRRAELHLCVAEALEEPTAHRRDMCWPISRITSPSPRPWADASGQSRTTCSLRRPRRPRSTTTKQPPDCGPPSSSASTASIGKQRCGSSSAPPLVEPASRWSRSTRVPRGGRDRARAIQDGELCARCRWVRGSVLAPRHARPACGRIPRRGLRGSPRR